MPNDDAPLSLPDAERLAERTLAAIDVAAAPHSTTDRVLLVYTADRERIASDLAGLREHSGDQSDAESEASCNPCWWMALRGATCADARRYSDGLKRTAALYGVTHD